MRTEKHLTIDQLAERLALSRTTIFYWVCDLPIPTTETQTLAARRAGRASHLKFLRLREAAYARGEAEFDELAGDSSFGDFVCMYIGEGSKRNRNVLGICNSDPAVIALSYRWFRRLTERPLDLRFQHHADQKPSDIQGYWGTVLGVEPDSIRFQRKSNSGEMSGRNWRSKHGVLTVRVADTLLRARMQAWMDRLRRDWTEV